MWDGDGVWAPEALTWSGSLGRGRLGGMGVLSEEQRAAYERDGVLVLPGFYSEDEVASLRERMAELLAGAEIPPKPTVFATTDRPHAQDEYFLTSGDRIRVFFEADAVVDGQPVVPLDEAINKIGHAMHDLDPVVSRFCRKPELAELAAEVGLVEPQLLQSMYIYKQPRIGGEVLWHTDHTFLWTDPQTVTGFWIALEPATEENGCLWCIPGGHRQPVKARFRREGAGTTTDVLDPEPYDTDGAVPLPADTGTLVVIHGRLPHWSAPNRSERSRHAFTLHVIDGTADYPDDNWLQRPDLPLRGFAPAES